MKHLLVILAISFIIIDLESGVHGDFLSANRTQTFLLTEKFRQYLSALQTIAHFLGVAFFKIFPVVRVEWIGTVADFCKADNIRIGSVNQPYKQGFPIVHFLLCWNRKRPASVANTVEIFCGYPRFAFLWMPAPAPSPQTFEHLIIYIFKRHSRHIEPLVIDPAANHGIQLANQPFLLDGGILLHGFPDFIQNPFEIFLGRLNQQLALVFADVAAKKIKAVVNMGNDRFFSPKAANLFPP